MKKFIPILFLSIYLVSVTELHEFFKLPQLVEHFIEHKKLNVKTTFITFLEMHYSSTDDGDADQSKDSQLPFKSHSNCDNLLSAGFITFNNMCIDIKPLVLKSKNYNNYSAGFLTSAHLSSIWQPPKNC